MIKLNGHGLRTFKDIDNSWQSDLMVLWFKTNYVSLYILSRGLKTDVFKWLQLNNIVVKMSQTVCGYGAIWNEVSGSQKVHTFIVYFVHLIILCCAAMQRKQWAGRSFSGIDPVKWSKRLVQVINAYRRKKYSSGK